MADAPKDEDDEGREEAAPEAPRALSPRSAALVALVALAVRAAYWLEVRDAEILSAPAGPAAFYDQLARGLPALNPSGSPSPITALFVAAAGRAFGPGLAPVACAQFLLGAATAVLVALAAGTAFIPRVGRVAGILAAIHAPSFHAEAALSPAPLAAFFCAAFVVLAQRLAASPARHRAALAGAAAGFAFLCRPDAVLLLASLLAMSLLLARLRPRFYAIAAAGLLGFLPVAAAGALVASDLEGGAAVAHGVPDPPVDRGLSERLLLLASGRELSETPPQYGFMDRESVTKRLLSGAADYRIVAPLAIVALPIATPYAGRAAAVLYLVVALHALAAAAGLSPPPFRLAAAPAYLAFAAYTVVGFLQCLRSHRTFGRALGIAVGTLLLGLLFSAGREAVRLGEAPTLEALGEIRAESGDARGAADAFSEAAREYRDAGLDDAADRAARLARDSEGPR